MASCWASSKARLLENGVVGRERRTLPRGRGGKIEIVFFGSSHGYHIQGSPPFVRQGSALKFLLSPWIICLERLSLNCPRHGEQNREDLNDVLILSKIDQSALNVNDEQADARKRPARVNPGDVP